MSVLEKNHIGDGCYQYSPAAIAEINAEMRSGGHGAVSDAIAAIEGRKERCGVLAVFDGIDCVRVEDRSGPTMDRARVVFRNGYELSVIRGEYSYGGKAGLFEIAIFDRAGAMRGDLLDEGDQGNEVVGWCDVEKVYRYVKKVAAL